MHEKLTTWGIHSGYASLVFGCIWFWYHFHSYFVQTNLEEPWELTMFPHILLAGIMGMLLRMWYLAAREHRRKERDTVLWERLPR